MLMLDNYNKCELFHLKLKYSNKVLKEGTNCHFINVEFKGRDFLKIRASSICILRRYIQVL